RDVIPERLIKVPAAAADDTIIEVAATMSQYRSPLVAVMKDAELIGVVTASRLLAATLRIQ
ncbi:CBS domain-containing protein, partial [Nocardia wallacei]